MATALSSGGYQTQNDSRIGKDRIISSLAGISWKYIFSGFFVALLVYWTMAAIGAGIGGFTLAAFTPDSFKALSTGAAIWIALSCAVALFVGAYVASRVSPFNETKLGVITGAVTTSLFFLTLALEAGVMFGAAATGAIGAANAGGKAVQGAVAEGVTSPQLQNFFDDELADFQLTSNASAVLPGVAMRFATGDYESARTYLARNSNLSAAEVDARFAAMRTRYEQAVERTKEAAGKAIAYSGWILAAILLAGSLASFGGGAYGAQQNRRLPLLSTTR